jgi:hypothetical protein
MKQIKGRRKHIQRNKEWDEINKSKETGDEIQSGVRNN